MKHTHSKSTISLWTMATTAASVCCIKPRECATHVCRLRMSIQVQRLGSIRRAKLWCRTTVGGNKVLITMFSNFMEFPWMQIVVNESNSHRTFVSLQSFIRQCRPDMYKSLTIASSTCKAFGIARYSNHSQTKACHAHKTARHLRQGMSTAQTRSELTSATASDTETAPASAPAAEDLVQYIVLRKDLCSSLKWPLGSVIAQACHASTAALWLSRDSDETSAYCSPETLDHMHKVV